MTSASPRDPRASSNQQQQQQYPPYQQQTPTASLCHNFNSYNLTTANHHTTTSSANSNHTNNSNIPSSTGLPPRPALPAAAAALPVAPVRVGVAWTEDEHVRFLDGLEKYGSGQATSIQAAWQSITATVRTRPLHDVKAHANRYFLELQMVNTQKRKEHVAMQSMDARWTLEEDTRFEDLLAFHSSSCVCYPWEVIAAKFPGKTQRDMQERYQKLCYDIARIEAGHHVTMSLGRFPRSKYIAAAQDRGNQDARDTTTPLCDCVVTLTPAEEEILMDALEQVHVSPTTSPHVLEGIASSMAAFANAKGKKPPQRESPLFTLEDARAAFEKVIADQQTDVRVVLETLVSHLKVHPHYGHDTTSSEYAPPSPATEPGSRYGSQDHKLTLATTGFAFGDPSPLTPAHGSSSNSVQFVDTTPSDMSRRGAIAEDLLSFRAVASSQSGGGGEERGVHKQPPLRVSTVSTTAAAIPGMYTPSPRTNRDLQHLFSPSSLYRYRHPDHHTLQPSPPSMAYLNTQYTPRDGSGDAFMSDEQSTAPSAQEGVMGDYCM